MSQENGNVEIARNVIEALNRGDVDAALRNAAPDFVLDQTRAIGLDRGSFDLDQVRRLWRDLEDHWESVQLGFDEFIATGEHVVTPFANRLTGRDGVSVEARGTWVWTIRNGLIRRIGLYQERAEALKAAGLSE
jgi:ketosteroid isomerase-like protein